MALADLKVSELLEQLAARTPSPGGGTTAGLAAAIAAALTEMAAAFALTREPHDQSMPALHARAGVLRARLTELADADRDAYRPVLEALAVPREDPGRPAALRAALSAAAEVPHQIVLAAAEVAELAATVAHAPGNRSLLGDASAAVIMAEAAVAAAARLIELNLATAPEDRRFQEAHAFAVAAAGLRAAALGEP